MGEPAGESAVEERVAYKEHEDYRKKGKGDGADDHFGFEAGAKLFAATLGPEAKDGTGDDQGEDD